MLICQGSSERFKRRHWQN